MTSPNPWLPRTLSFVVWALLALSLAYWGLRWDRQASGTAPVAASVAVAAVDTAAVARLLGSPDAAATVAVSTSSRFALSGVVARGASHTGAALIAVDGKAPKAYSVGSKIEDGLYLQAVAPRRATLGARAEGPASMTLELPAPSPTSSTGSGVAGAGPAPALAGAAVPSAAQAPLTQALQVPPIMSPALATQVQPAVPPVGHVAARAARRLRPEGTSDTQD